MIDSAFMQECTEVKKKKRAIFHPSILALKKIDPWHSIQR